MKRIPHLLVFLLFSVVFWAQNARLDQLAYTLYSRGNDAFIRREMETARTYYLQIIQGYPQSRYMPYALFMYSYTETNYPRILDALSFLVKNFTDFPYWTNAVEKLGDIYYVMGNHAAAIETYSKITTDEARYRLGLLFFANGFQEQAIQSIRQLLIQTRNQDLIYRSLLVLIKSLMMKGDFAAIYPYIQRIASLRNYAYDNGLRGLYYIALYYAQGTDAVSQSHALYLFSLLRRMFPLSSEAILASQYIAQYQSHGVTPREVAWVSIYYDTSPNISIPDPLRALPISLAKETRATTNIERQIERQAQIVRREIQEYVVRIGTYKDLSVANIIVRDIIRSGVKEALGVYYRRDMYVVEIRGLRTEEAAQQIAARLIALGYTDTVVVEVARVVRFEPPVQ